MPMRKHVRAMTMLKLSSTCGVVTQRGARRVDVRFVEAVEVKGRHVRPGRIGFALREQKSKTTEARGELIYDRAERSLVANQSRG